MLTRLYTIAILVFIVNVILTFAYAYVGIKTWGNLFAFICYFGSANVAFATIELVKRSREEELLSREVYYAQFGKYPNENV